MPDARPLTIAEDQDAGDVPEPSDGAETGPAGAEGVNSVHAVLALAALHDVEMPICETVAAVVAGGITPGDAVDRLMGRVPTTERHHLGRIAV